MTRALVAILCSTLLAGRALAVEDCPHCVLGLYADPVMTSTSGPVPPGTPTDLYLGIAFDPDGRETRLSGIECSISGIGVTSFIVGGFDPIVPGMGAVCLGNPAPGDPPCIAFDMFFFWPTCLVGSQPLLKFTLVGFGPNPNRVLRVGPPHGLSGPTWSTPIFTRCDPPTYTVVRVTGGCFVANPTAAPPSCAVGVLASRWTGIKQLYQ